MKSLPALAEYFCCVAAIRRGNQNIPAPDALARLASMACSPELPRTLRDHIADDLPGLSNQVVLSHSDLRGGMGTVA